MARSADDLPAFSKQGTRDLIGGGVISCFPDEDLSGMVDVPGRAIGGGGQYIQAAIETNFNDHGKSSFFAGWWPAASSFVGGQYSYPWVGLGIVEYLLQIIRALVSSNNTSNG